MGDVVNLRRARKGKARAAAADDAASQRALHGRTKAEKARDAAEKARMDGTLDSAKRE